MTCRPALRPDLAKGAGRGRPHGEAGCLAAIRAEPARHFRTCPALTFCARGRCDSVCAGLDRLAASEGQRFLMPRGKLRLRSLLPRNTCHWRFTDVVPPYAAWPAGPGACVCMYCGNCLVLARHATSRFTPDPLRLRRTRWLFVRNVHASASRPGTWRCAHLRARPEWRQPGWHAPKA